MHECVGFCRIWPDFYQTFEASEQMREVAQWQNIIDLTQVLQKLLPAVLLIAAEPTRLLLPSSISVCRKGIAANTSNNWLVLPCS